MKKCGVETFTASLLEPTFETLDTTLNQKVGTRDPFQQLKRTKTIVQVSVEKMSPTQDEWTKDGDALRNDQNIYLGGR